jgi:ribose transport system substrate-binding protein
MTKRHRGSFAALAVLGMLGLVAAGCGSSGTSTGSSATTPSTASSSPPATTTGSSGSTSNVTKGLTGAEAFVAKYSTEPSKITITTPIGKPVPKGKKLYFIPCGSPECLQEGAIVQQAGDLLGWTTVVTPNDGSPQGDKAAFEAAISGGANGILYTAIDESIFASLVPQMKAKGIVIATCCNLYSAGSDQVIYDIDTPNQTGPVAGGQSAIVADVSKCTDADSVFVTIPDFPILGVGYNYFKAGLSSYCPGSTAGELNISLANLATVPSVIVSYVRAHSNVHYLAMSTDSLADGVPAALKAAGITDVKIVGQGATPTNIQYLKAGEEVGDVAFPYYEVLYGMVDAIARHYAGAPVLPSTAPPLWLLNPTNAPAVSAKPFAVVPDYEKQYAALWGVGA